MSWTDKRAIETIKHLRDRFQVREFVETGTYKGLNAQVHALNFDRVNTIEFNLDYYIEARERLKHFQNVNIKLCDSPSWLRRFAEKYKQDKREDIVMFYLDAHFYNPKERWVVQRELDNLKGFKNSIIVIHDFNNGLGHCIYDGERLGFNVVGERLKRVNPNFHFYTNRLEDCDIMKPEESTDQTMRDNLEYAWKTPRLTYRGILYCLPSNDEFKLRKISPSDCE